MNIVSQAMAQDLKARRPLPSAPSSPLWISGEEVEPVHFSLASVPRGRLAQARVRRASQSGRMIALCARGGPGGTRGSGSRSLAAELLQDGGPKFVAVNWLRQVALKARRTHAGFSQASRDEGDGRHPASLPDVQAAKPLEKLAVGRLCRGEITHDDVGNERGADGVDGARRRDDGARQLEHRPKEVARELVVIDEQNMNLPEVRHPSTHLVKAWSSAVQDGLHVTGESVVGVPRESEWPRRVSALSPGVFRRDGAPGLDVELLGELDGQQPDGLHQGRGRDGQLHGRQLFTHGGRVGPSMTYWPVWRNFRPPIDRADG